MDRLDWDITRITESTDLKRARGNQEQLLHETREAFARVIFALREENTLSLVYNVGFAMALCRQVVWHTNVNSSMVIEYVVDHLYPEGFSLEEMAYLQRLPEVQRDVHGILRATSKQRWRVQHG